MTHTAEFVRNYADFLESHIERWTVTRRGTLVPGIRRHYIRINPGQISRCVDEDPNCGTLILSNQRPGDQYEFPRRRSLMRVFSNSFATEFVARTIR